MFNFGRSNSQMSEGNEASQLPSPSSLSLPLGVPPVGSITTTDHVCIHYELFGSTGPVVVLLHGWSGSRHYWDLNTRPIARTCRVITVDLRHHGDSDKPLWGYHVARLAADLREVLIALQVEDATVVGASMGAAILWSYWELFGQDRISKMVFFDQAPLQNTAIDWKAGSTGCYDLASLTRLQCRVLSDFKGFAKDNAKFCASPAISDEVLQVLESETLRASPVALAALMADHTALDWRPVLQRITIPCVNVVCRKSAVFPWWGVEEVGRLIGPEHCRNVYMEECNHWGYIEDPAKFNTMVVAFAHEGLIGVDKIVSAQNNTTAT